MAVTFNQTGDGKWTLDVRGYACPQPQMYTKKALQKLGSGDELTLVFDKSIQAMCDSDGNDIIERVDGGGSFSWTIRKT